MRPPAAPAPEGEPAGNLRGDAVAGAAVYQQYCVTCHGAGGKGDGPTGAALDPRPADHSDPAVMGERSDTDLYLIIDEGGAAAGGSPMMAPWGPVLTDEQMRDLVAHIRALSGT